MMSPCLFSLYTEYLMGNAGKKKERKKEMLGQKKHKLDSRLPGEISITSDMQMTPPLRQTKKNLRASR